MAWPKVKVKNCCASTPLDNQEQLQIVNTCPSDRTVCVAIYEALLKDFSRR